MTLTVEINLSEQETHTIRDISSQTGLDQSELVRQALSSWIEAQQEKQRKLNARKDRLTRLRQGRGLWKGRTDLPDFRHLRSEWDREMING